MKKLLALMMILVLALTAFTSCNNDDDSSDSNGGSVDIGIVLPTKEEPRWVQDETRFKDALKDTDYNVEILFSQGDSAREKQNVETLIAKGIDVLIITPHDGAAAAAARCPGTGSGSARWSPGGTCRGCRDARRARRPRPRRSSARAGAPSPAA